MSWGLAYRLCEYLLKVNDKFTKGFLIYFFSIFVFSWVGAKLLFLLVTKEVHHMALESSFWLGGGFVFLGGFIFATILTLFAVYILRMIKWDQIEIVLPSLAFSHALGRVGCFLAGCCYGKEIHFHEFPFERYPVQLMESAGLIILGIFLWKNTKNKKWKLNPSYYLVGYGSLRFCLEFLRGDIIRGIYTLGISTSQIVSIFMIIAGMFLIMKSKRSL